MPLRITSNMILQQTIYSTRSGILACWFSYVVSYLTSNALIYAIYTIILLIIAINSFTTIIR